MEGIPSFFRSHPSFSMAPEPEICGLSMQLALRLMIELQGHRQLLGPDGIEDDEVARSLGLGEWLEADTYDRRHLQQQLRRIARRVAGVGCKPDYPEPLGANLKALAQMLGLNSPPLAG